MKWRRKGGLIMFFSLVIIIMAIFMSGSRGGVVSLIAGVIVMLFILRREGEVRVNLFLLLIILSLVTGLFFIVDRWEVLDTLSSLFASHEDISLLYRLKGWEAAIQVFKDFPVAGTGFGTFSEIFLLYRPASMLTTFNHAHNEYLQFLTYALAGFSNFSCIGIQIGGIGALSPKKRSVLIKLGMKALLGGTLTNLLNAAIASLLI